MEVLQIVLYRYTQNALPENLQRLFSQYKQESKPALYYETVTILLECFEDRHILPLNQAMKEKKIVHWSCGQHQAFNYIDSIILN